MLALAMLGGTVAQAQDSAAARSRAAELSRAWAAIGTADFARAQQVAAALLRGNPADHAAIAVNVAAIVGAGQPVDALNAYEQWLLRSRHEDVFLLLPIGTGTLASIASGTDLGLAVEALSKLAAFDPDAARAVLAARADPGADFDGVRASLGDESAVTRLTEALAAPTSREKLLALRHSAGVAKLPPAAVTPLLSDPAPPVRAAAIETLARVQGNAAADSLRPLLDDPDLFVQATAAVALGRLSDPRALGMLTRMLSSDIGDNVAMAAPVLKERGVDVSAATEKILADPNPLTRLSAVPLLSDASRAQSVLSQAASDSNPVVRARAAQFMTTALNDLPAIRRLLRDSNAEVRLGAADSLLHLSSGR